MQIGEFVARLQTSKETVRHYEDLGLLTPARQKKRRIYGEKDLLDFEVIRELKSLGMGLKEIQLLFELKRAKGCGDRELIAQAIDHLSRHLEALRQAEADLRLRRERLEEHLAQARRALG